MNRFYLSLVCVFFLFSCAGAPEKQASSAAAPTASPTAAPEYSADAVPLDAAIIGVASYFTQNFEPGAAIALVKFDAETATLSDYILEELWIYFEDNSSLTLVDRTNLELISKELDYQASGEVSDDSARSIGKQFGPQTLLYGKLTRLGDEYRISVYATDVERATSSVRAVNIRPDSRLSALLQAPSAGDAGANMANALFSGTGNPFGFTVETEGAKGEYHDGEYMSLRLYSEKDAWFKITHVDVNGNVQVIYPVSAQDDNFIKAGQTRRIPDNTQFKMTKPYGQEMILASAYDAPFVIDRQGAAALSSNTVARGLIVEDAKTQGTISPAATAKFSYSIKP